MDDADAYLEAAGDVVEALAEMGLQPVLVGGMALVVLGSRRVTRDFDFVVARPGEALGGLLKIRSRVWRVASEADLLRLKEIARAHRSSPGDAADVAFLEARRSKRR
jgi:hypothetical protein